MFHIKPRSINVTSLNTSSGWWSNGNIAAFHIGNPVGSPVGSGFLLEIFLVFSSTVILMSGKIRPQPSPDIISQAWPLGASYSQSNQEETEQSTGQWVKLSAWTQCWCVSQYWAAAYLYYFTSAVFKLWYASVWLLYGTRAAFNGTFEEEIKGTPYIHSRV